MAVSAIVAGLSLVRQVGFEPTVDVNRWFMRPEPATNTASVAECGTPGGTRTPIESITVLRGRSSFRYGREFFHIF